MRHPTDGTLRRLIDEPDGVPDADRGHVATCPVCLAGLAAAQHDAALVGAALRPDPAAPPDVDSAWLRLTRAVADDASLPRSGSRSSGRSPGEKPSALAGGGRAVRAAPRWRRPSLRRPVVAAVGAVALLTGAGAAAAADWLPIFRTERIAPAPVSRADLVDLPDLSAYGDVEVVQQPDVRVVADAAEAAKVTGLTVPQVRELPRGVRGEPTYQVGDRMTVLFTFSAEKAARSAAATGRTPVPSPGGLDGSRFRLSAGPGVAAVWSSGQGLPALAVGRAGAPTAVSSGVPFETARDYLLSLPGLPPEVAAQLRAFSGTGTTLPLPVPADTVTSSTTDVAGVPATLLTTRDGSMAGVVWVDDGVVTAVAGSLSADEVLTVARRLGSS
jgi:hypothetical protein